MCLFMFSVLYSEVKFEIDTNNDEVLETIWEHIINIREIKWGTYSVYFLINKISSPLPLLLSVAHTFKVKLKSKFKIYLTIRIYLLNLNVFPSSQVLVYIYVCNFQNII
jgi:hypothetical protein